MEPNDQAESPDVRDRLIRTAIAALLEGKGVRMWQAAAILGLPRLYSEEELDVRVEGLLTIARQKYCQMEEYETLQLLEKVIVGCWRALTR